MIGQVVSKYQIVEILGRGAMGIVFRAVDTSGGPTIALKILAEKLASDPEMLSRFEREGSAASRLRHPNICTTFESGNWQGRPFIAMELLDGQPLDQLLGKLTATQLTEIAAGVLSALEATHAIGVIHRDIKPANLFLTQAGQVKVLDFGVAKVRTPSAPLGEDAPTAALHVTRLGMMLGTIAYMSPEQVCCEPLDGRADLYSLGVTLYELATGSLPGAAKAVSLAANLDAVVAKLMARAPHMRYQTAREAREALLGRGTRAIVGR